MSSITSFDKLEELGRVRLSRNFFMRDFLHSEIAAWHGLRNVPDHPERAVEVGSKLCGQLLEPLQDTFGRIHVRSGYRAPAVNDFGNKNKLNCASNESNYSAHIWDYPDPDGKFGATACIVIPWLVDHVSNGGHWSEMAWWIHDHLPYSSLYFFPKLSAFNINWHEAPQRRIDSYAAPKGCLTRPGMDNHTGSHRAAYLRLPALAGALPPATPLSVPSLPAVETEPESPGSAPTPAGSRPALDVTGTSSRGSSSVPGASQAPGGAIFYRAVHTKTSWRKVNTHRTLDAAINGKDGAAGLFARKVRINYETHGDPLFVLVWQAGANHGYLIRPDSTAPSGIRQTSVPVAALIAFEDQSHASQAELARFD